MVQSCRAVLFAALICLAMHAAVWADCRGHDLFPELKQEAPAAYAAIENAASEMPFRRGKLFRLSRAGTAPSYVFATLHLSDPRATRLSPGLRSTLTQSKVLVLESVETGDALRQATGRNSRAWHQATAAAEDQSADRLLDRAEFAQLEALMADKGFANPAARAFNPSTLALLLDLPNCARRGAQAKSYVEELIAGIAREHKIKVAGLESMIEQVGILNKLPRETERDLLIAILRQADRGEDSLETAIARYAEGDIGGYLAWLRSDEPIPGVTQAQIPPAFLDRLIPLRNYRMRDRALPYLQQGGAFIAVGAAHLPGADGLLSLFEKAGYTVEAVE